LPEKFKKLEDSFMTQQRLSIINSLDKEVNNLSSKRKKKRKKEEAKLSKIPHLNLIKKKLIL